MSYIGNEPIVSATRTVTEVTATAGQTVFTANGGYTVGFLDVFINGSKLTSADFTATNGTTVTLTEAAQVSDIVRLEALGTFLASNGVSKTGDTMTGALLLPDGSASAPALSNDGDSNTGIFFPAADTIAFAKGGAEAMRIDSSGLVGINTTTPSTNLTIDTNTGNYTDGLALTNRLNWGYGTSISFRVPPNNNAAVATVAQIQQNYVAANQFDLRFSTYNSSLIERMRLDSLGNLRFDSGYGSVATAYGCRAWVNFNGTGTAAIRASGNVSSVTDNGTGDYTINFTNAMPDINYTASFNVSSDSNGTFGNNGGMNAAICSNFTSSALVAPTTTAVRVGATWSGAGRPDPTYCSVTIFR